MGDPHMGTAGWVFLGLAWAAVIGLLVWTFARVLSSGGGQRNEP